MDTMEFVSASFFISSIVILQGGVAQGQMAVGGEHAHTPARMHTHPHIYTHTNSLTYKHTHTHVCSIKKKMLSGKATFENTQEGKPEFK